MRWVVSVLGAAAIVGGGQVIAGPFDGAATKGNLSVWRINEYTAAVSLCSYDSSKQAPSCYPWSEGADMGSYKLLAGDDLLSVWRINAESGQVSMCEYQDINKPPMCTPWGSG